MQCVALLVALAACLASAERTSPLLMWSNREGLVGRKGQGAQMDYSVIAGDSRGSIANSIMALLGKTSESSPFLTPTSSDAATKHLAIVVFIGSYLDAAAMRKGVTSLSSVLDSSAASLVMPFAACKQHKDSSKTLSSSLDAAGVSYKSVGCELDKASDDLVSDVSSTLASSGDASQVLLVCPPSSTTLDQELEQLLSVQEAIDASERSHVVFYLSEKSNEEGPARRRVLATNTSNTTATSGSTPLIGFGQYTTCGQLCQTQVRYLEGMLTVLFMALAISAGLTCLNALNGPSKFDVQKAD